MKRSKRPAKATVNKYLAFRVLVKCSDMGFFHLARLIGFFSYNLLRGLSRKVILLYGCLVFKYLKRLSKLFLYLK
jgi:hypothetical protein